MRANIWRQNGDIMVGAHLRDTELENKAAVEADRLLLCGEEVSPVRMPVPPVGEGECRDATNREVERHFRWRVFQIWEALREARRMVKPARKAAKAKVSP